MTKPTLSVLIPNYNHGQYISNNLDAILGQSWRPDEIIIVDDGSTDDSMSVINQYARRESRIRAYRNERNMGVVYTLNRALGLARANYCYGSAPTTGFVPGSSRRRCGCSSSIPRRDCVTVTDRSSIPTPVTSRNIRSA